MRYLDKDGICHAQYERSGPTEIVNFAIDINIDGVQLFKNSTMAQGYPILGRVHSVNATKIPIKKARPFVVGVYQGPG